MRSKSAWRRSLRDIKKSRKRKGPPKGKGGGKRGNIRGEFMEQMVNSALAWLEDSKRILDFYQEDRGGKDFVVMVGKKRGRRLCTIEVKSSERKKDKYMRKKEVMRKKGIEGMSADLVIVVCEEDNIFTLAERIAGGLGLS